MTNAELAVLSLVAERPRHGYQIDRLIEDRGMREWTEVGFSSIYYLLRKLERDRLIEGRLEETQRGPPRKVYCMLPEGREKLRAALLDVLSVPRRHYSPLQLGLANLPGIPASDAARALRLYRQRLAARLQQVRVTRDSQRPLPYFVEATFDYSITMIEAELKWVARFTRQMEERHV